MLEKCSLKSTIEPCFLQCIMSNDRSEVSQSSVQFSGTDRDECVCFFITSLLNVASGVNKTTYRCQSVWFKWLTPHVSQNDLLQEDALLSVGHCSAWILTLIMQRPPAVYMCTWFYTDCMTAVQSSACRALSLYSLCCVYSINSCWDTTLNVLGLNISKHCGVLTTPPHPTPLPSNSSSCSRLNCSPHPAPPAALSLEDWASFGLMFYWRDLWSLWGSHVPGSCCGTGMLISVFV